jgi:hypothetical protein
VKLSESSTTVAMIRVLAISCVWLMLVVGLNTVAADLTDQNESCSYWASLGECDNNPGAMKNKL